LSSRHVLDARQLRDALSGVRALYEEAGESLEGLEDNPQALESLAREIDALISSDSTDPESFVFLMADVAAAAYLAGEGVSGYLLLSPEFPAELARGIRTEFAISCVALLARSRRHVIPVRQFSHDEMLTALRFDDKRQLVRLLQHALGIRLRTNRRGQVIRRPVPRAFIATPLTHLDDESHRVVMQLATGACKILTSLGIAVIKPDPNLTPSTASDRLASALARDERLLITGSDLLVAIGAEHDSWGVSRSVSWAEGCCSVVIVASTTPSFLSRVLDSTPHRVRRLDAEENPRRLLESLEEHLRRAYPLVERHARDRLDTCKRVRPVLIEGRKRLHNLDRRRFGRSLLTSARAGELLDHPVLLNHASLGEARELRRLLGATGDALIDAALDRTTDKTGPFPRVGTGLSADSYSNLLSVASTDEWSYTRVVRLVEEYLSPTMPVPVRYRDNTVSGAEWRRLNERIFGSGDVVS
jgi:hypothetical protein